MPDAPHELLIAAPERWDEACFSVPAVRALVASGLGTGILCPAHQQSFWQSLPGVKVQALPPKAKEVLSEISGKWQAALLWEHGLPAKWVHKAKIPKRIGPAVGKLQKLLTDPLTDLPGPLEHRVQFYLRAAAEMGVETSKPEFFAPADLGVETSPQATLLVPDSDFGPSHEWPLAHWRELAQQLQDDGHTVTVGLLAGGRNLGESLAGELPTLPIDLSQVPLKELSSYHRVIAADGSLPHLASHAGATCITLFGPNDPQWKRPLGKRHTVVHQHAACAPCLLAKCPLDLRCQNELAVERVRAAL